jgi:glycosyltransferase involved in cell wall biosynthesis
LPPYFDCPRYQNSCGNCPQLDSCLKFDPSFFNAKKKQKIFSQNNNFHFISPSNFIKEKAQKSFILKNKKIIKIPNGVNKKQFFPIDKNIAREKLNLPKDKKILFFNGASGLENEHKNFKFLRKNLPKLNNKDEYLLLVITKREKINLDFNYQAFSPTIDLVKLNLIYNASDITLVTSKWESFSLTALESMACQKVVLSFDCGGVSDIIENKINGILTKINSWDEFQKGIDFINSNYQELSKNAYQTFLKKFTLSKMTDNYIDLYQDLLKK